MEYDLSVELAGIEALVFRAPVERPVRTSFGVMHSRPMLLVRAIGRDGSEGWGEVWCNFPNVGAEHRAGLIGETIAPLLVAAGRFPSPQAAYSLATERLAVLAIQSGEPGPLAQAIAGIDIALWDLVARRNGVSVQTLLGGRLVAEVPAYASGINPDNPETQVEQARREGHRAFKLKIGFGAERDLGNLKRLAPMLKSGERLMADANQAWSLADALAMAARLAAFDLEWLEEPLRADAPLADWQELQRHCPVTLAAGENLRGEAAFTAATDDGVLGVIQPDIGKWGGFSGCLPAMRRALASGRRFCPHWLGGGIGLVASGHLLAAAGGDGRLEMDVNPNPLRTLIAPVPEVTDGLVRLPDGPGLGVVPRLDDLKPFATA
jgi:L-alanine-DL-glutamate epimerase-like enolase superfamily enzyme